MTAGNPCHHELIVRKIRGSRIDKYQMKSKFLGPKKGEFREISVRKHPKKVPVKAAPEGGW